MKPFSSSQGWNALALTLLSAHIHPNDKAASMPQCLSCKPTLRELQSTMPPSQCPLFFPPQAGFAPASDKGYEKNETEDSEVKPLWRNMNDPWKVNSYAEENYTRNENISKAFFFFFYKPTAMFEYCCVLLQRKYNTACMKLHKISFWHQSGLPTTLKPLSNTWAEPASL